MSGKSFIFANASSTRLPLTLFPAKYRTGVAEGAILNVLLDTVVCIEQDEAKGEAERDEMTKLVFEFGRTLKRKYSPCKR